MAKFTKLSFCQKVDFWHKTSSCNYQKVDFWHKTSSCNCPLSLYCVCNVSNCFNKSCGTSCISRICTIYARHTKLLSLISSHFAKKVLFWHDTSSCTCSIYLNDICNVSESFSKSSGTSRFPRV